MSDFIVSPAARQDLIDIIYRSEKRPIEIVRVVSGYRDVKKLLD